MRFSRSEQLDLGIIRPNDVSKSDCTNFHKVKSYDMLRYDTGLPFLGFFQRIGQQCEETRLLAPWYAGGRL